MGAQVIDRIPMRTDATYSVVDPLPFAPHVRLMRADELPYVAHSWAEGYKNSPRMRRKTWADYKALDVPALRQCLARRDTEVLCCEATVPGHAVGWVAFARWPSIDIVHWVYVAKPFRRRGVMTALLEGARLRNRVSYTHQAAIRRHGEPRADLMICDLLRKRGVVVSYVPYQEWSK
jgi:GNAT superfamily N-acetyltransferase